MVNFDYSLWKKEFLVYKYAPAMFVIGTLNEEDRYQKVVGR